MDRRDFLTTAGAAIAAAATSARANAFTQTPPRRPRFRIGLVAYTFQRALAAKTMTYEDLVHLAVDTGIDGLDLTVYWLPSTANDYLFSLRRLAFRNRVEIYGISVRVYLAQPTPELRDRQLAELTGWVNVAERLGASHIRVFGGPQPAGVTLDQAVGFAVETLKRGAEIAGSRGITLGVENDGGITSFAKETIAIATGANSSWAGVNLDTGNFRPPKVYDQIEMSIPHAVNAHVKTAVALDDGSGHVPADLDRMFGMFARHGYRGYMGLEYEGTAEEPATAVPKYLRQMQTLAAKYSA